jgi:hypothetical protein
VAYVNHLQRFAVFSTPLGTPSFRSSLQELFMAMIIKTNLLAYSLQAFFIFFIPLINFSTDHQSVPTIKNNEPLAFQRRKVWFVAENRRD